MPAMCQNMLNDRQTGVVIDGTGEGWYTRGQRLAEVSDISLVRLNCQLQVTAGTGSVGLRIDWRPSDEDGNVSGNLSPLVPLTPVVANGQGAKPVYTGWIPVDPAAQAQGYVLLRTIFEGTPGITFLVDYAMLQYK